MRLHHLTAFVAALLAAVALTSGGMTYAAAALHSSPLERARSGGGVTVTNKVTLPETSIAGPALTPLNTRLAWTGTDTAHHLNVATGPDGLHFPTKTTLPETSLTNPVVTDAVSFFPGVAVAWTGTDPAHLLNVELVPGGTKLTLHESGLGAPAIAQVGLNGGQVLLLVWTGIDPNHSLNVLPLTPHAGGSGSLVLVPGTKTVLPQFNSDAGPSLLGNENNANSIFVLGWSVRGTQRLNLAESTDGAHFTSALGAGLPETSAAAPQFIQPAGSSSGCITWTGTDAANHLNVAQLTLP